MQEYTKLGFTKVFEGTIDKLLDVYNIYSVIGKENIELSTKSNSNYCKLYVANEYIDWKYYRELEEFRPIQSFFTFNLNNPRK